MPGRALTEDDIQRVEAYRADVVKTFGGIFDAEKERFPDGDRLLRRFNDAVDQVLKGVCGAVQDEPGTLPGAELFQANAQNAECIFAAVLGNSDVFVRACHTPRTSASEAIMRMGREHRKRSSKKTVDKRYQTRYEKARKESIMEPTIGLEPMTC